MSRRHNFCAGPAALPEAVLQRAADEMLDWHDSGMSFMEMSHRSPEVVGVAAEAEASLRRLLGISDDFAVLFAQGGASTQFAAVPLNLAGAGARFDYVNSGQWSRKAMGEGGRYGDVRELVKSGGTPVSLAPQAEWPDSDGAAFLHYTPNETIDGVEFPYVPETSVPLVADMSSTILSRPLDVEAFDVIYAGAQKNIGPAGLTLLLVRRELYGRAMDICPAMLNWQKLDEADSMLNTPPTFAIYLAGLVFAWLEQQGGLDVMGEQNRRKAETLYGYIDASDFYGNPVAAEYRSWMNVPFTLEDPALDKRFLADAETAGLLNLKGHRSVGGMRASIYNATGQDAVDALVSFMGDFERQHG